MGSNPLEQLFRPILRGFGMTEAQSRSNQHAGRTLIVSGTATITVSTTTTKSDSIILLTPEATTRQTSGVAAGFEVTSKVEGAYFTIARADGQGVGPDTTIMWMLWNTS